MTKAELIEKGRKLAKEYKVLSDKLWEKIQTGEVHGRNAELMVGSSPGYNLFVNSINRPKTMKKSELQERINEMEENMNRIKQLLGQA